MQQPKSGAYKASPCWRLFCSSCLDSKASKRALRQWDNFMFMVAAPCWAPLVFCEQDVPAVMSLLASPRPIAFPWPEGWAAVPSRWDLLLQNALAFSPQGAISSYFVQRYGFPPGCKVVAFTGDNPGEYLLGLHPRRSLPWSLLITGECQPTSWGSLSGRPFLRGHLPPCWPGL